MGCSIAAREYLAAVCRRRSVAVRFSCVEAHAGGGMAAGAIALSRLWSSGQLLRRLPREPLSWAKVTCSPWSPRW